MKKSKAMRFVAKTAAMHLAYVGDPHGTHREAAIRLLNAIEYPVQAQHVLVHGKWAYEGFWVGKWQKRLVKSIEKLAEGAEK